MLILKQELRSEFKKPLGVLYSSLDEAEDFIKSKYPDELLISVGDITTQNLQKAGLIPHLGIIDNVVERKPAAYDVVYDNVTLNVKNPPGVITDELQETIKRAFQLVKSGFRVLILVDGEEDLAAIPSILMAPPGSLVLYGQPGEGLVVCEVDKVIDKVKQMKNKLEER
ncbi:MAG: GTP-dependent dephospho-CoA kinase [Methanobacterium sp.]|uniref:GTP-dependent dephospho-CoA kinase family protein n=1 Tax=Methanobacterium sp. TaxID=2164 RepID=UPI0024ABFB28|nr:GTP-dependent dephospho-CoA kinase family protein [Methanobacterium sp.]MDI3549325.1 GTP-dependent dephospho-CoA kinase [Methanobacterium sp.]